MFQVVSNIYNRNIITSLSLEEFISMMKSPDFVKKSQVDLARKIYKDSLLKKDDPSYKSIKSSLPCITFLNIFDSSVKNENIVGTTGFMYLDIDNLNYLDLSSHSFVVAYWKSLSNNGYGILIKCTGISENLLDNIQELSDILNIDLDKNAVSKDRLNVLGYDYNIKFNSEYTNYEFNKKEKVSSSNIINKSSNRLRADDTKYEKDVGKLRFSNLDEIANNYDFKGEDYVLLEEKIEYAEVFVPNTIFAGNRNNSMFILCSQIRGLNTWISQESLFRVCNVINKDKFKPELGAKELDDIVRKVYENNNPVIMLNKMRRILYNPRSGLTKDEKSLISGREMGKFKKKITTIKILDCIDEWNFNINGKITFEKISSKTGLGIATVKRRGKEIKPLFTKLNQESFGN